MKIVYLCSYHLQCFFFFFFFWGMFTPSPTWMSCQAAAIDIHIEHSEGEKATTGKKSMEEQMRRCCGKETESRSGESLSRVKQWRQRMGNNHPSGSEFIKSERMCEKWEDGTMTGEEQENELSTCQRIKALSWYVLTRSCSCSSPQCLNLMSQVLLRGSCIHQHPHTAIISLCNRRFIALYSQVSISIVCYHDLHPSYCHVTCWLTFSMGKIFMYAATYAF